MWLVDIFKRNKELEFMFDLDLIGDQSKKAHLKKLALDTCINFIARTISQSEFRVRQGKGYIKDELYYRLNIRPNKNQTASTFWQSVIYKLIDDNEVLVIQVDDGDLLIADDFQRVKYAVYEDTFKNVVVNDYEFQRSYRADDVFYLEYNNKALKPLIDEVYTDYGELFASLVSGQKRKYQIRSTVDLENMGPQTEKDKERLQKFINKVYEAFTQKDVAVVPQQKGFKYEEHTKDSGSGASDSVEEINKLTDGFLDKVAMAIGIPLGILHGEMADLEKQTKNYRVFTVSPLVKKIADEGNAKFVDKKEYLSGKKVEIRQAFYKDIFELSTAADKLRSSGIMNGHEIRDEMGLERVDDPSLDEFIITKNYGKLEDGKESNDSGEGGEN